jgi:RNA polymerase sigma factor (sigma-70 family)
MSGLPARVMQSLRGTVGQATAPADAELLDRFVRDRDEHAFEALVRRYSRIVHGACRRALRRGPDVEDAWQATFLTLACKASAIGDARALGAWLHKVAVRIALRVRADVARRAWHETQGGVLRPDVRSDEAFLEASRADLRAVLDEAIDRLPEKYRVPVVLCYLEGKTNEEAAAVLGCPTGTVVTRLARARDRLRAGLGRRGVGVTLGVLAGTLVGLDAGAAAVAPAALAKTAAVFVLTRSVAGTVPARAAVLTEGALQAMSTNRLKVVAGVLVALCLVAVGPGLLVLGAATTDPPGRATVTGPVPVAAGGAVDLGAAEPNSSEEAADDDPAKDKPKNDPKKSARSKAEEVVNKSFKTGQSPNVTLDLFNGTIEVIADAAGTVDAQLTKHSEADTKELAEDGLKNIQLDLTQDKDVIKVTAKRLRDDVKNRSEGVNAVVKVPAGAVLDLGTSNGSVKLVGGTGKVVIKTKNGSVRVTEAKGELDLSSSNGGIVATGARGRANVKTSNGDIDLQVDKGAVTAHTSNGEVRLRGSLADGEHSLTTNNGRIALTLPAATQFRVDATTTNGTITTDFVEQPKKSLLSATLKASVGDNPAVGVKLHTTNGAIQILKEKDQGKKP